MLTCMRSLLLAIGLLCPLAVVAQDRMNPSAVALPALGEEVPLERIREICTHAELMIDVARLLGSTAMAETMFHGVRIGGSDRMNTPFAWGFGRRAAEAAPGR